MRRFVAAAEKTYREHRNDLAFDFGQVIGGFAKALEVQCGITLRAALRKLPQKLHVAKVDDDTRNLTEYRALTLGRIAHVLVNEPELNRTLTQALDNGAWFTGNLPAILRDLIKVRNPGTHESRVDRQTATGWRNRLLGVGSQGIFVELARVRVRG